MPKHIFLSPHLDDVVLSCGGLLHQLILQGEEVHAISIFAGLPPSDSPFSDFAQYQHEQWGDLDLESAYRLRRQEDQTAFQIFGLKPLWLDFLDCIYRGHPEEGRWFYTSDEDIFGPLHPEDMALGLEIFQTIENHLSGLDGQTTSNEVDTQFKINNDRSFKIYAPLTLGNHVDHQLAFIAAKNWQRQSSGVARQVEVYFYEDYPYIQRDPTELSRITPGKVWRSKTIFLTDQTLHTKINAMAAYTSQLNILFGGEAAMREQAKDHLCQTGQGRPAERLWY